jgi:hypothetical protein
MRPSEFSDETAYEICSRLAQGESLNRICKSDDMPGLSTVYRWLDARTEFRERYARAREDQADTLADEILDISDESPATAIEHGEGEVIKVDGAAVAHQRLRVDTRKWIASKLKPKKYGDKQSTEISGPEGGAIPHSLKVEFVNAGPVPGQA